MPHPEIASGDSLLRRDLWVSISFDRDYRFWRRRRTMRMMSVADEAEWGMIFAMLLQRLWWWC